MSDATRELIFDAQDLDLVKITMPYWKTKDGEAMNVYIKQMSGADADEYVKVVQEEKDAMKRNIKAIICCVCDANGERLFRKDDLNVLMRKNNVALNWLTEKVLEVNFKSSADLEEDSKN